MLVDADAPFALKHPAEIERRRGMLSLSHIAPLVAYVARVKAGRGAACELPLFDPCDGGTAAKLLFLLEAPGPKAVSSSFISRNNPDLTARNMNLLLQEAELPRRESAKREAWAARRSAQALDGMGHAVATPHYLGVDSFNGRQVYLLALDHLRDFPLTVKLPCRRFVLLLAGNANTLFGGRDRLAQRVLNAGCVYFCGWGPGCERMHDAVDQRIVLSEINGEAADDDSVVMTTWHDGEPLRDAVFFALFSAEPVGRYAEGCDATLITAAGGVLADRARVASRPLLRMPSNKSLERSRDR